MLLTEYRQFKVDKLLVERSIKENKSFGLKVKSVKIFIHKTYEC